MAIEREIFFFIGRVTGYNIYIVNLFGYTASLQSFDVLRIFYLL